MIPGDDQGAEAETASALNHFCAAVDGDNLFFDLVESFLFPFSHERLLGWMRARTIRPGDLPK
jgi:hypothetical protein